MNLNLLNSKRRILLGPLPSKERTDFFYIEQYKREKLLIFIMLLFVIGTVFAAYSVTSSFNLLNGFGSEQGLSSLVDFIFASTWLLVWSSGILTCVYLFLLSLFARDVVLIQDGILEMSLGMKLIRYGPRIPLSEVESIELNVFKDEYSSSKIGTELIVSLNGKAQSWRVNEKFTEQDITELQTALTSSKQLLPKLGTQPSSKPIKEPAHVESDNGLSTTATDKGKNSLWALVIANSIPLFGAYFLDWQLAEIMVIYWAETLVLLLYQSIRNIAVSPLRGLVLSLQNSAQIIIFASVQFLFIWAFFIQKIVENGSPIVDESLTTVFNYFISIWPALLALLVSHGYSLYLHFFKNPNASKDLLSTKPLFFRIAVMHLTIVGGAFLVLLTKGHWATLLLLMVLKTAVDAKAHCKQHNLLF